jgi:predicted aconitase
VLLTGEEQAMRAGEMGPLRQWAIEHQIKVGRYLGAEEFVPVVQAHIMADTESLGEAGVAWLERWAGLPQPQRLVRIPTTTNPRGTDFAAADKLKQQAWMLDLERRAIAAFESLGVLMTDTCINYQTIMPPVLGEHVAFGDTGAVIYTNSVCGARSNFEGGPSALGAGITGRTPRYGFHLDEQRQATLLVQVSWTPRELSEWGALGGIVGCLAGDYGQIPALVGIERVPHSDEMKHFGAALASFGSVALFHMAGITPEALRLDDVVPAGRSLRTHDIGESDIRAFRANYAQDVGAVDLVVFSAPQLSLMEMRMLADLLDGHHTTITLLAVTSPQTKPDADRMGLTRRIESAGGTVLSGMCFYQSYAREMAEANGWRRLATNSAKLTNIIGGYGYKPVLLSMEECVGVACNGGRLGGKSRQ